MTTEKEKIFISIDTEFEHECVTTGNCLQIAFVAFRENLTEIDNKDTWLIDTLSVCFEDQGKLKDERVMDFWSKFPEIHNRILTEAKPIEEQMLKVEQWLIKLTDTYDVTFLADIANVDFCWLKNLYMVHSNNTYRMPYKCLCLNGMEEAMIAMRFNKTDIRAYCKCPLFVHTHYALDDAMETAHCYLAMKKLMISYRINVDM